MGVLCLSVCLCVRTKEYPRGLPFQTSESWISLANMPTSFRVVTDKPSVCKLKIIITTTITESNILDFTHDAITLQVSSLLILITLEGEY